MLGFSLSTLQKYLRYLPILAPLIDSIYTRIAPKGGPQERSIQDTPVDLSKLEMAIKHLVVLKVELRGIQETRREMDAVMEHVYALREILENAKKPRLDFSSTTIKDLENLGVTRKYLNFIPKGVEKLLSKSSASDTDAEFASFLVQLDDIYKHVNMDFEAGARMILHAILLSIAKISEKRDPSQAVAILPEMRLGTENGVMIHHPISKHQAWLTGSVDHSIVQCEAEASNKVSLLGVDANRDYAFKSAAGRLFLVEAKPLPDTTPNLSQHMPEAVSQALALRELTNQETVRFCLSNGHAWIFALLKKEADGRYTYYEAAPRYLDKLIVQWQNTESLRSVQVIVELLLEWLIPSNLSSENELYEEYRVPVSLSHQNVNRD